jgi:hypothetical protein
MTGTGEKKKTEPPFGLDMDFGEAMERFFQTDPKEVAESIERSKQKKPPGDAPSRRPARSSERGKGSSSSRVTRPPDD